jgi:hypothetical protein
MTIKLPISMVLSCYLFSFVILFLPFIWLGWLVLWCLMPLSTIFQLYRRGLLVEETGVSGYVTFQSFLRGCRGRDRMVAGFTTTCVISVYHHSRSKEKNTFMLQYISIKSNS